MVIQGQEGYVRCRSTHVATALVRAALLVVLLIMRAVVTDVHIMSTLGGHWANRPCWGSDDCGLGQR